MTATRRLAFVGRQREEDVLRAEFATVSGGRPRVALVVGDAGIGKTALVERFLAELDEAEILRGNGDESESDVALGVLDQVLRRAGAGLPASAGTDHVGAGTRLLDALGDLERRRPIVVVIDDAHWADALSLRALLFAARRFVSDRVLILLTSRDHAGEQFPAGLRSLAAEPTGTTIALGPLTADELGALGERLGIELSARAAQRLHAHTEGNPLYATALLQELEPERWQEAGGSWPAPRSFAALVHARADACGPDGRRLIDAVAVLGHSCSLAAATALAAPADPLEAIEAATDAGLLAYEDRDGVRVLAFTHPLSRAAIYQGIGAAARARLHRRAAALDVSPAVALRHRIAAASGVDEGLAVELEAFAATERARAGWSAVATSLVAASRLSAERPDRERRLLEAVEASLYAGDGPRARRLAEQTGSFDPGPLRDSVLAYVAIEAGREAEAEALLDSAWDRCDAAADPALAATIAQRRAFLESLRLRATATVQWARRASALSPDDDVSVALATWTHVLALDQLGRAREAHAVLESAIERMRPAMRSGGMPLADIQGLLHLGADELTEAHACLTHAAPLVSRHGSLVVASATHAWLARTEYGLGLWDDAAVHADRSLALAIEADDQGVQGLARWVSILVGAGRGALREIDEHARALADLPAEFEAQKGSARMGAAQHAAARGEPARVRTILEPFRAMPPADGADDPGPRPWQALYADALVDLGALAGAEDFLAEAEPRIRARGRPSMSASLARVRGRLEAAHHRRERAALAFEEALALIEPLGMPFEQARIGVAFGQFLRRDGRRTDAAAQLTAAKERLEALAAAPLLERCDRELEACGLTPVKRKGTPARDRLTPRERAVARLAAAGMSNREIAAELMLSVKTVERHLSNVFAKRSIHSRGELGDHL